MLGLQIDEQLAQLPRDLTAIRRLIRTLRLRGKETRHSNRVEPVGLAPDGTKCGSCLLGPLCNRAAEDNDGSNQLIANLLRPIQMEAELVPIVGRGNGLAFGSRHASPPARGGGVTILGRPKLFQLCVPTFTSPCSRLHGVQQQLGHGMRHREGRRMAGG
jgi:hypothetical protein